MTQVMKHSNASTRVVGLFLDEQTMEDDLQLLLEGHPLLLQELEVLLVEGDNHRIIDYTAIPTVTSQGKFILQRSKNTLILQKNKNNLT